MHLGCRVAAGRSCRRVPPKSPSQRTGSTPGTVAGPPRGEVHSCVSPLDYRRRRALPGGVLLTILPSRRTEPTLTPRRMPVPMVGSAPPGAPRGPGHRPDRRGPAVAAGAAPKACDLTSYGSSPPPSGPLVQVLDHLGAAQAAVNSSSRARSRGLLPSPPSCPAGPRRSLTDIARRRIVRPQPTSNHCHRWRSESTRGVRCTRPGAQVPTVSPGPRPASPRRRPTAVAGCHPALPLHRAPGRCAAGGRENVERSKAGAVSGGRVPDGTPQRPAPRLSRPVRSVCRGRPHRREMMRNLLAGSAPAVPMSDGRGA